MNGLVLKEVQLPKIVIDLGDKAAIEKPAQEALDLAESMTIDSQEMAQQALAEINAWKAQATAIETWRFGITRPIDAAKETVMDFVRAAVGNFAKAEITIKNKVAAWQKAEREREAREEAEAKEKERQERLRLEAEAREQDRLAHVAQEEAAAKQRAAQEAQNAEAREKLQAEADAAARQAEEHREEAAIAIATSQVIRHAPVQQAAKVSGMRFTDKVELVVHDKLAFLKWVVANPAFIHLVEPDLAALKALQKSMKDQFNVDGVGMTKDLGAASTGKAA